MEDYFKSRKTKKRQVIFQEGDTAEEVYLIQEGEFSLFKAFTISITSSRAFPENSPLKTKNISKQSPISILSKGTMFGEEEITSGGEARRNTTCMCTWIMDYCLLLVKKISKNISWKMMMQLIL
ncbi:unnamed protein product [Blepharisma stoltei]|uniref:Cyclic nucleotide-binding domain-containing protein n=1 Tax=Blepharisma stoltei TaxID=1481888 RepID=A0AAU9JFR3_9CILI|nr:unnamed protein product [Blepharisma stoltei]